MDLSTASEASDAPSPEPVVNSDLEFKIQNTPAIVRWRDTNGETKRLVAPVATPLGFVIDHDVVKGSACLKLLAAIKMKSAATRAFVTFLRAGSPACVTTRRLLQSLWRQGRSKRQQRSRICRCAPAYSEHSANSVSKIEPPLTLSPRRHTSPSRKRRRAPSSSDVEVTPEKQQPASKPERPQETDMERIQRSLDTQNMILAKILARVESIEGRLEALESRDLADDVQACMEPLLEPLWDELDSRIVASEDKTHDYVKDMVEETVNDKVGDLPELVSDYFHDDEGGRGLLHDAITDAVAEAVADVVSERDERIREDTMNFLKSRPFTAQFTFNNDG
ncbi:hypothetical protein PG987_014553 [Apiospora arundinis]